MKLSEKIADSLLLSEEYIEAVAHSASYRYKKYKIDKRQGGKRTIYHPAKELKSIQRWLLRNIIEELPFHDSAFAYRKGRNIVDHAKQHVDSAYLLRMDLRKFFPSINKSDISNYIEDNSDEFNSWFEKDIDVNINLFCSLVCKDNHLTIGAPTSPALSNALCRELDITLNSLASEEEVVYTRYADDLFFSTKKPDILSGIEHKAEQSIGDLSCPKDLHVNHQKTRHSSKRGRRQVTGLVLGSDGQVHFGRTRKRKIRSMVYKIEILSEKKRKYLAGMLGFAQDVEPGFINALVHKYGPKKVQLAFNPQQSVENN